MAKYLDKTINHAKVGIASRAKYRLCLPDIFFAYVCPSMGVVMSALMYAAPVKDLREALVLGKLGNLNPIPWAVMTGNCLGWTVYAYYTKDPFILASNIPGMLVSVWLNMGAAKLQYYDTRQVSSTQENADNTMRSLVLVPQEVLLLRILLFWFVVLIGVGWVGLSFPSQVAVIGIIVNINLLFFYGAPLQTIQRVIVEGSSASIHRPMMRMNWLNTSFWTLYGFVARNDPIIFGPNAIGLVFGLIQGILCCIYPGESELYIDPSPLLSQEESEGRVSDEPPAASEVV